MKKSLLFLGLLGLASSAYAQRWTVVNTTNVNTFDDTHQLDFIHTVSQNVAWGLTYTTTLAPGTTRTQNKYFVRTNNAAGTEFDWNSLSSVGGGTYEGANIEGINSQTAVAAMFNSAAAGGGQILRTTDGGTTWSAVQGTGNLAAPLGFNNWVHMFDATTGVAFGDPNTDASTSTPYFEILRTTDGGATWTRVPSANIPAPIAGANEGGLVRSYFALQGTNTIWASTSRQSPVGPCRILKSTDRGLTWTAYSTPLTSQINRIAFKDPLNGIAFNTASNPVTATPPLPGTINVIRTSDGGQTWTPITPINNTTGQFYSYDIDAVPATATTPGFYVSAGSSRVPNGGTAVTTDFGSSTSSDGINWRDIDNGRTYVNSSNSQTYRHLYLCMDVLSSTAGYAGSYLEVGSGAGGIYKLNAATPLATRSAATDKVALNAYPNPSTGVFKVQIEGGLKATTALTVTDALGRQVYSRQLTPSSVSSEAITVDLSKEKTGVYVMELRSELGVSQKKLVVQ
jgi:hypothetical protein